MANEGLLVIEVTPPNGPPRVITAIGKPGTPGSTGWSPLYSVVPRAADSEKVLRLVDWIGGTGTKPVSTVGKYVGVAGLVTDIADAAPIRGNSTDGEDGADGADGSTIHLGTGIPGTGLGNIGDQYVDVSSFTLYNKTGTTTWTSVGSFAGSNGDDGADGSTIIVGSGVPNDAVGKDTDVYIDGASANRNVYVKAAGSWGSVAFTLRGPQGPAGADSTVPGPPGDDGNPGADGEDGASLIFGSTDPTGGVGADGYTYFQTVSKHFWTRTAGSWTDTGSLRGDDGADGVVGSKWYHGSGDPNAATATWSPSDKTAHCILSDSNHLITTNSGSGNEGARSSNSHTAGKRYVEFSTIDSGGFAFAIGLANAGLTLGDAPQFSLFGYGGISIPSGGGYSGGPNPPTGHHIGMAFDFDASPPKAWIRIDGGPTWLGPSGTPDPETNTSGFDLTGLTGPFFLAVRLQFNPCTIEINAGDRAFDYPVPAGFTAWAGGTAGVEDDFYLDDDNGDVYSHDGTDWGTSVTSLKGDDGEDGDDGAPGADGVDAINAADMMLFLPGLQLTASQVMVRVVVVRDFDWPSGLTGSLASARAASTGTKVLTVEQNGVGVATITFTASATGVLAAASAVNWVAGDILTVTGAASADATLSDISLSFLGSR